MSADEPSTTGYLLPPYLSITKIASLVTVSHELLHPRELTPEEQAKADERRRDVWRRHRRAVQQLKALTGLARRVLDLHSVGDYGSCEGCDFGGYEGEAPPWPCRTVLAITQNYEIDLPESMPWGKDPIA